jgi:hypothetical protein
MTRPFDETLASVAERMFEGLAFMLPMPEADADGTPVPSPIAVRVAFDGPFAGTLVLVASEAMLPALARNMLGFDEGAEPPREKQMDALKELINVICGNLLPAIAGPAAVFDVRAPEVIGPDAALGPDGGPPLAATVRLTLDEGKAELSLYMDDSLVLSEQEGAPQ